jgi:hypothetical protein
MQEKILGVRIMQKNRLFLAAAQIATNPIYRIGFVYSVGFIEANL